MVELIAVGHISIDRIKTVDSRTKQLVGGAVLYFSLAAAISGVQTGLVTRIGNDFPLSLLKKIGGVIDTKGIVKCLGKSTRFDILYENDFEAPSYESFRTNVGDDIRIQDIPNYYLVECRMIHICPMRPSQQMTFRDKARQLNLLVSMHTSEFFAEHERESVLQVIKGVDIFFCNLKEAKLLSQEEDEKVASRFLQNQGIKAVIVTKGKRGALLCSKDSIKDITTKRVKVVDPTGAGDVFAGGVVSYFLRSKKLVDACFYGNMLAAEKIKGYGPLRLLELLEKRKRHLHGRFGD